MGRRQDFTNSIIYHIRHMESKEVVYVGSTTNFSQRKAKHKYLWNKEGKEFKYPIYCHIRDNGGFDYFEIIPIKSLKLENKTELIIAEQVEIDKHRNLVNRQKAHMTIEEHKEYDKKWREEHKEELKEYNKQYYQEHKEIINEKNKEYQKEYREEHKEVIAEKMKLYYQENKEIIKEKQNERVKCPICNSTVTQGQIKRHQLTKKCQEYLNK
jgi:intracellular sulfur oxidation DsrE/DsrF family protein